VLEQNKTALNEIKNKQNSEKLVATETGRETIDEVN